MIDVLLPRTDAGVLVQLVIATVVFAVLVWRFRRNRDARIFVVGLWVMAVGLMGVRALH